VSDKVTNNQTKRQNETVQQKENPKRQTDKPSAVTPYDMKLKNSRPFKTPRKRNSWLPVSYESQASSRRARSGCKSGRCGGGDEAGVGCDPNVWC
jgi:hypothetical protein